MKCSRCKVELGPKHLYCPLCGARAVFSEPRVSHHVAEYPPVVRIKRHAGHKS